MGVKFPAKKRYVRLEWPLTSHKKAYFYFITKIKRTKDRNDGTFRYNQPPDVLIQTKIQCGIGQKKRGYYCTVNSMERGNIFEIIWSCSDT